MMNHHVSTLFATAEEFEAWIRATKATLEGISNGTIKVPFADKATKDGNGKNIAETYALKTTLETAQTEITKIKNGDVVVGKANKVTVGEAAYALRIDTAGADGYITFVLGS